jgi:hypothetical protein
VSLSRSGFELNEIWVDQRERITESDARMRGLARKVGQGTADGGEIERLHHQQTASFGKPNPEVTTARYQSHARRRDAAYKKYRESDFKNKDWGDEWTKHRDSTNRVVWQAHEHHSDDASSLMVPHTKNGHNVSEHVRDLLRASGSKAGEDLRQRFEKQEDGTHDGRVGSSFFSGLRKEVGERFDKGFKKHYPKSTNTVGNIYVDSKQTDRNGRRLTIHPDDMGHA